MLLFLVFNFFLKLNCAPRTTVQAEGGNLLVEGSAIGQRSKHYFETLLDVPENIKRELKYRHIRSISTRENDVTDDVCISFDDIQ